MWRGERFRPRSCSDSQTPGEWGGIWGWWGHTHPDPSTPALSPPLHAAPDPGPCRRTWGHSASSPSLLDPCESGAGTATPDKVQPGGGGWVGGWGSQGVPLADGRVSRQDGRSHWGRVKVLLTRLARRSLRGGRCR